MPDHQPLHYEIQTDYNNSSAAELSDFDLNFRNIPEDVAIEIVQDSIINLLQDGALYALDDNTLKVYRKTILAEAQSVVEKGGLAVRKTEKWITESFAKVIKFQNQGVPLAERINQRILEFKMDKNGYKSFRKSAIPQFKSKNLPKSRYNYEGIKGGARQSQAHNVPESIQKNIGIHKDDIENFNKNIKSIKVLDPSDPFVKNKFLRYLSENKLKATMIAIEVTLIGKDIVVALLDTNGNRIQNLIITISNIAFEQAGTYIISAICSFLPGIGSLIGGLIGNILFGFISKGFKSVLCGLFYDPHAKEQLSSDYLSFIYRNNRCFGEPFDKYTLEALLNEPWGNLDKRLVDKAYQEPQSSLDQRVYDSVFAEPQDFYG